LGEREMVSNAEKIKAGKLSDKGIKFLMQTNLRMQLNAITKLLN
jgi:hypothetical protein